MFEIALENKTLEKWQSDLETLVVVLGNAEVAVLLENPKVSFSNKREMLHTILPSVAPQAMNLAYLLVARNRLRILADLLTEFRRLVNEYHGREEAQVVTAVPIGDEEKRIIEKQLATIVGKDVVASSKVDPNILGGLVARLGDRLVDGSVRTKLHDLRRRMA